MFEERLVNSRPDRELWKKLITPGDYSIVPYEDSCCRISVSNVSCTKDGEPQEIEAQSHIFSSSFDGNVLIGSSDSFLDKDFELILQQMCLKETAEARMIYRDGNNVLVKEIKCKIALKEVTEEQLISDWGWVRLYEAATTHKVQYSSQRVKKSVFYPTYITWISWILDYFITVIYIIFLRYKHI